MWDLNLSTPRNLCVPQFGDYCLTIGLVALILGIVMVACTGEFINPCKRHHQASPAAATPAPGATATAPTDASSRAWDAMEPTTGTKRIEDEAAALGVPVAFLAQVCPRFFSVL